MPLYGVLLRVYTPKPDEVADRVRRAMVHVDHIQEVAREFPRLVHTTLVVPKDYDCGETAAALTVAAKAYGASVTVIHPEGHHSREALNDGVRAIYPHAGHALIVSGKALSYLTKDVLAAFDAAFKKGAKVAGLALPELADIVSTGRIQNTFAAWELDALTRVGRFDSTLGVEEMAPLIHLVRAYGRCIAPIECIGGTLDIHDSETAKARHAEVMRTKLEAQESECARLGSSFEFIEAGVIH